VCESWTAPVDVERVRPAQDANVVAAEQVRSFLRNGRLRVREEGEHGGFAMDIRPIAKPFMVKTQA
jgi:hypothetical protein